MSKMMIKNFKSAFVLIGIVLLATLISSCRQPLCCGAKFEEPPVPTGFFESQKRQHVIDLFLDYQSQQNTAKVISLFTKDNRDKMADSNAKLNKQRSDADLKRYIQGMRQFVFFNEKKSERNHQAVWVLSYQHEENKGQFILYYLMQEGDDYKILEQRTLKRPN